MPHSIAGRYVFPYTRFDNISIIVAAVGAVVGAGGLGAPIISGLVNENQFFIAYGSIAIAFLSIFFNSILNDIETLKQYPH